MCCSESLVGMESLPRELLRLVIDYLMIPELISLDNAILNKSFRSDYILSLSGIKHFDYQLIAPQTFKWLTKRNIAVLNLSFVSLNEFSLKYISRFRSVIQKLFIHTDLPYHIFGEVITPSRKDLNRIGRCPSLKSLFLSDAQNLTTKTLQKILKDNPQIGDLDISGCPSLSLECIQSIVKQCQNLQFLDLSRNDWVTDAAIDILLTGCPRLKSLHLDETSITDNSVDKILMRAPSLHDLQVLENGISVAKVSDILDRVSIPSILHPDDDIATIGLLAVNGYMSKPHPFIESSLIFF